MVCLSLPGGVLSLGLVMVAVKEAVPEKRPSAVLTEMEAMTAPVLEKAREVAREKEPSLFLVMVAEVVRPSLQAMAAT